ncbi:MAG: hypothetical protein VX453_15285 [Acidobacteriota bacterium]|nr:hypothetical protein [Acidobacteriota bacterium]
MFIEAARGPCDARPWILATVGRFDDSAVRMALAGDPLLTEVEPLLALSFNENWLVSEGTAEDLRFLLRQHVTGRK